MPGAIRELVEQIKGKGFFYDQIKEIARGFNQLRGNGPPYISSVIEYFLSNDEVFDMIQERYFAELHEKLEAKNAKNKNG